MPDKWKWQRREKKLQSKKDKIPKHGKSMAQMYADSITKKVRDIERRKLIKDIDELSLVASNEKAPKYSYGKASYGSADTFVPQMKEFGTAASGGFSPTMNYSGQRKKILDSIHKLHESKIDEIEDEAEEKEPKTPLQEKILGTVENFEEKMIQNFINEYEKLAILSKEYSDESLGELYLLAKSVNQWKSFNLAEPKEIDRLEQVIFVDSVAHNLHKQKFPDGSSLYKQLDELANISKSIGESFRDDRLLLLQSVQNIRSISQYDKIEVFQKSSMLEKSKSLWGLFEKAIKIGVEKLNNKELILLREWIYSKI